MDRKELDLPAESVPVAPPTGFGLQPADDPTLVQKNPLTASFGAGWEDDEQPTVIKPTPLPAPPTGVRLPVSPAQADTLIEASPMPLRGGVDEVSRSLPEPEPHEPSTPVRSAARSRRSTIGWLGWVLAVVGLGAGLIAGLAMGVAGMQLAGLGVQPVVPAPPAALDARLNVQAPPEFEVRINGRVLDKNHAQLSPGEPHTVEILGEGYQPYTTQLTLEAGEVRLLFVNAQVLEPVVE
jgi:hypothetical protein